MGNIGPVQLLLIVLIILLIFGAGRVAEIGQGLGAGIRNFKKGLRGDDEPSESPKQLAGGDDKGEKKAS